MIALIVKLIRFVRRKNKDLVNIAGNILAIFFIISLIGVSVYMVLRNEGKAEHLGNMAYLFLLLAVLTKLIYHKILT